MKKYEIDITIDWTEHQQAENKKEAIEKVRKSFKKDFNIDLISDEIKEVREVEKWEGE